MQYALHKLIWQCESVTKFKYRLLKSTTYIQQCRYHFIMHKTVYNSWPLVPTCLGEFTLHFLPRKDQKWWIYKTSKTSSTVSEWTPENASHSAWEIWFIPIEQIVNTNKIVHAS